MPTLESLTEADIQAVMKSKSLNKAYGYLNRIQNPTRSGKTLTAQVRGTYVYDVEIDVEPDGINASCSCPYDWGGYCKHIGAVLLKWIQSPAAFASDGAAPAVPVSDFPLEVIPVEPPPTRQPKELPFWIVTPLTERVRLYEQRLAQCLNQVSTAELRQMAQKRGWKLKGTRKTELAAQIVGYLTQPAEIEKAVLELNAEHRAVLCALLLLGEMNRIQPEELERVASLWSELKSYKNPTTYLSHLYHSGLVTPGHTFGKSSPWNDTVHPAIARNLPPMLEAYIPAARNPPPGVTGLRQATPYPFIQATQQVLMLLEHAHPPLRAPQPRPRLEKFYPALAIWDYDPAELARLKATNKLTQYNLTLTIPPRARSLPDDVIDQLAQVAGGEARLEFIFSLLVATGIVQPGSPVTVWSEVKEHFLRLNPTQQWATLAATYCVMTNWSELWELLRTDKTISLRRSASNRYFKPETLDDDLARCRRLVLRALASLPDGQWVRLSDFLRVMRTVWPRFDQSMWYEYSYHTGPGNWFLASFPSGRSLDSQSDEDWARAQGHFIQQIIVGPLHWLGLAGLGFDDEGLVAFCLNGLRDLFWDRSETPVLPIAAPAPVPVADAVRADRHTIAVAPSAIQSEAHNLLNRIAHLETATADRFTYRLDSQIVHQSFENGLLLSDLFDEWQACMPIPMPDDIRQQLTAWWEAYGRVRIYQDLTVVEFSDDYALAEMKAITPLEDVLIAEISPRLILIPRSAVEPLTQALEQAGYMPKQTDDV